MTQMSRLLILVLLAISPVTLGRHYTQDDCDATARRPIGCICPEYTRSLVVDADETYYVELDEVLSNGRILELWVYQESNGVAGLQRHDAYCTDNYYYDNEDADTIVY